MAIINKTGITDGSTIQAEHVTRTIDALSGGSTDTVVATGSFTGSFTGDGSGLTGIVSSSYAVTASYADNALSAINTPNAVITASNTGNDDTIEFLKGGGGAFSVTVNNVVSSSYALTASYAENTGADTNFANTDLIFTANRSHNTDGNDLFISVDGNFGTTTVTDAFLGIQAAELTLGFSQSAQTQYVGDGITHTGNTIISGSLTSTGLTEGAGTNTVAMYDTGSGQFFYTASSAIGTDTNFANTDLTFTADRNHDSNGFDFVVSADNGGFNSAYIGYQLLSLMGAITQSFLGVQNTAIAAEDNNGYHRIGMVVDNTSSINIIGGANGGVNISSNSLFVSTVTDNVSVGKNTSNAKLDVNGDTIISGSLTVSGSAHTIDGNVVTNDILQVTNTDSNISAAGSYTPSGGNRAALLLDGTLAVTLANGTNGGILYIYCSAEIAPGTTTITPTNAQGFTSLAFNAIGDTATLMWMGSDWYLLSSHNVTVS